MSRHHVMVVDDDEGNRDILALLLAAHDMQVEKYACALSALARLTDLHSIDLIISDVSMPEMDGVDFAQRARRLRPDLPVILLTGHNHVVDRVLRQGAMALLKPYEPDRLLALVDEAVGRAD